jgi:predicted TIM-barrel fold metal-dependent hydrolase
MSALIDVHTHLHPPRLFAAIRRWFAANSRWDLTQQPTDPFEVAEVYRNAGVERFVFCSYAHKPDMAAELNTWLTDTARALDRYGIALATVHLDDRNPHGDLVDALDRGAAGLKIHEDVQGLRIDDARFTPVLAELERREAIVLAHVGHIPWSRETDDGPRRIAAVLERHPQLKLIVAHLGSPDTQAYLRMTQAYPTLHLDTTMALAPNSPMKTAFSADDATRYQRHVLYGTDFPNIPYEYLSERKGIEAMELPPDALRAIFHDNAARLLAPFL